MGMQCRNRHRERTRQGGRTKCLRPKGAQRTRNLVCPLGAAGACDATTALSQRPGDSERPIGRRRVWLDLLGGATHEEPRTLWQPQLSPMLLADADDLYP